MKRSRGTMNSASTQPEPRKRGRIRNRVARVQRKDIEARADDPRAQAGAVRQKRTCFQLALGLYTTRRRLNVVRMGRRQKTRTTLPIPVHPELAAIMAASSTGYLTFLVTEYGRPFTAADFGGWFRKRCDEAGHHKECAFHSLRKAACTRRADAGCSTNVIASIGGHASLREVERYTKAADQRRLARIGMDMMRKGNVNTDGRVDDSRRKA
jgi:integrase